MKRESQGKIKKSLLSSRLRCIASLVTPGGIVADIGTDHGFLPVELVKNGICSGGICSDIGKGPIERARQHVSEAGETVASKIDVRLGDGLSTLKKGEADSIVIAGMGGLLIRDILKAEPEIAADAKELILSPHTEIPEVRRYLSDAGFVILNEKMILEDGKFYTVIRAVKGAEASLTDEEIEFGPVLLRERPETFLQYLQWKIKKTKAVFEKLSREKETALISVARREKEAEIRRLETVLQNGKPCKGE